MRRSVRKIGRYSYHGLAFSAGRSIASMMVGWLFAAFSSLRNCRLLIESVLRDLIDEALDVGAVRVERGGRAREPRQPEHSGEQRDRPRASEAHGHEPISLRCECSDIRMPKPANKVTIEVPP